MRIWTTVVPSGPHYRYVQVCLQEDDDGVITALWARGNA